MTGREVIRHDESDSLFVGTLTESDIQAGAVPVDPCELPSGSVITTGLGTSEVLPSMDFETYSAAGYTVEAQPPGNGSKWVPPFKVKGVGSAGKGGLPVVGTPAYAEHPTTEILSLVYDLKDGKGRRRWLPGDPDPADLLDHIRAGGLIEAHNVTFEWYIWNFVGVRRHGWPALPLAQTRCSKAKAKRHSLPGALDPLAKVLGTTQKDKAGHNLIRKLCVPLTPTKGRAAHRWTPATAPQDFDALYRYNDGDVVAEDHASAQVPDLTPYELATWQTDQVINARGVQVDVQTLDAGLAILDQAFAKYNAMLAEVTGGAVTSVSQNARFIGWVNGRGVQTQSLDADHRAALLAWGRPAGHRAVLLEWDHRAARLAGDLPDDVRRALKIAEMIMSANVRKLRTLKLQLSSDGRLRDQYQYCGADRTGRWSAGGVQLQNITAKGPKTARCGDMQCGRYFGAVHAKNGCPHCGAPDWAVEAVPEWTIDCVRQAVEDIRTGDLDHVERIWGAPVDVLCGCLRGLFMAKPGHKLVCVDFSAIEAVAAACLARCQWRIDLFNTPGECIYTMSASKITGTPLETYKAYRAEHGSHHPDRKNIGKIAELASGYGGWINAWKAFGADMPDAEIKEAILAWRDASPEIVEMWGGQYKWCGPGKWDYRYELHGLEGMAIAAIQNPGSCYAHNDITYGVFNDILYCKLPSGRFLHYHRPRLHPVEDKLNRGPAVCITFEGYNSNPQKGRVGWGRWETFGGRLYENVVQAVSCDIQAEALVRLERAGYPVVMHTHDEACSEVPDRPEFNVAAMEAIMSERPAWASWWPIRAAGWEDDRYQKD